MAFPLFWNKSSHASSESIQTLFILPACSCLLCEILFLYKNFSILTLLTFGVRTFLVMGEAVLILSLSPVNAMPETHLPLPPPQAQPEVYPDLLSSIQDGVWRIVPGQESLAYSVSPPFPGPKQHRNLILGYKWKAFNIVHCACFLTFLFPQVTDRKKQHQEIEIFRNNRLLILFFLWLKESYSIELLCQCFHKICYVLKERSNYKRQCFVLLIHWLYVKENELDMKISLKSSPVRASDSPSLGEERTSLSNGLGRRQFFKMSTIVMQ